MEVQMKKKKKMLKSLISKVLKALKFSTHNEASYQRRVYDIDDENEGTTMVPKDVKEGHFAVIAMKGEEAKRFIIELHYLTNHDFLILLEKAKEEFGFEQKGVLIIPCRPQELEKILDNATM